MKKYFITAALFAATFSAFSADQFYVIMKDGSVESYPTDQVDSLSFTDPGLETVIGLKELAAEVVKLRKEVDSLKANCCKGTENENGGSEGGGSSQEEQSTTTWESISEVISSDTLVDLGLSVKWANFNLGASKPYEYGDFYQWAETTASDNCSASNSKAYGKKLDELVAEGFCNANYNLVASYDAATVNWGSKYKMPTKKNIEELIKNTTSKWVEFTVDGKSVNGVLLTSKVNGKALFLPAAGYRLGTNSRYPGKYGNYWSASANDEYSGHARDLTFDVTDFSLGSNYPYTGQSIRPVSK